jgi:hypothetical protein
MDFEKEAREVISHVALHLFDKEQGSTTALERRVFESIRKAFNAGEENARKNLVGHFNALPPEVTGDGKKVARAIEGFRFFPLTNSADKEG